MAKKLFTTQQQKSSKVIAMLNRSVTNPSPTWVRLKNTSSKLTGKASSHARFFKRLALTWTLWKPSGFGRLPIGSGKLTRRKESSVLPTEDNRVRDVRWRVNSAPKRRSPGWKPNWNGSKSRRRNQNPSKYQAEVRLDSADHESADIQT